MEPTLGFSVIEETKKILSDCQVRSFEKELSIMGENVVVIINNISHIGRGKSDFNKCLNNKKESWRGGDTWSTVISCYPISTYVEVDWSQLQIYLVMDYAKAGTTPDYFLLKFNKHGKAVCTELISSFGYRIEITQPAIREV